MSDQSGDRGPGGGREEAVLPRVYGRGSRHRRGAQTSEEGEKAVPLLQEEESPRLLHDGPQATPSRKSQKPREAPLREEGEDGRTESPPQEK